MNSVTPCGHDHGDNLMQALTCRTARQLRAAAGGESVGCIILPDRTAAAPAVAAIGNISDLFLMTRAFCELGARVERPADCRACQVAHDRMRQALVILQGPLDLCQ